MPDHPDPPRPWQVALLLASAAAGATAVWVRERARQAERDHPPQGRYMHVDGVRLHYLERGSGPVVVLLHGNSFYMADPLASGLVDRLAQTYRVVLFDRPGFGHSQRPRDRLWTPRAQGALLHQALVALGIDRPLIVGHSLGALVALAMALDFPTSVVGLVLLSGYYYPTLNVSALLSAQVATPVLGDALRYTVTPISTRLGLGHVTRFAFAPREVAANFFREVQRELLVRPLQLRADSEDAAFMLAQVRTLSRRYPHVRLPVAVLAGAQDHVVDTDAHSRRLAAELPNSRLHIAQGVGHMIHFAAQEAIAAQVDAVFEESRRLLEPRTNAAGVAASAARSPVSAGSPGSWLTGPGSPPA